MSLWCVCPALCWTFSMLLKDGSGQSSIRITFTLAFYPSQIGSFSWSQRKQVFQDVPCTRVRFSLKVSEQEKLIVTKNSSFLVGNISFIHLIMKTMSQPCPNLSQDNNNFRHFCLSDKLFLLPFS